MPFGSGPRMCPGRYLALLEMKMAMAMLLAGFDIEAVDTPDGGAGAGAHGLHHEPGRAAHAAARGCASGCLNRSKEKRRTLRLPAARSRPSRPAYFGTITVSMTWITPLSATMSTAVTLAASTVTPPAGADRQLIALRGLDLAGLDVLGHHLARHHVGQQHRGQLGLVLQQRVQVGLGDLGEGRVGRREHGVRALALERIDQAGGGERRGQSVLKLPAATAVSTMSLAWTPRRRATGRSWQDSFFMANTPWGG